MSDTTPPAGGDRRGTRRRTVGRRADRVPSASVADTLRLVANPVLPFFARGPFARRKHVVRVVQWLDLDARAVRSLQRMRTRYGPGPLRLRLPGRRFTFLLEPDQVHRVLDESPVPFSSATVEKRAGLGHYQPEGLIISSPQERAVRAPFNAAVLDEGSPLHRLHEPMTTAVREEATDLLRRSRQAGVLTWDDFLTTWWRGVRRVMLGDSAREDEAISDELLRLRNDANRVYLIPSRGRTRSSFLSRMEQYVEQAEPGSLAGLVASTDAPPGTVKHQQMVQWLFASDGAGFATFRTLALLAAHPEAAERARAELDRAPDLPFLRACVLESLRLWPAVPVILRDTTEETRWPGGSLPSGAPVIIFAPFFHRDGTRLAEADRFSPELWLGRRTAEDWPLVPFSGGPGMCPGRNVALLTATTMLATLLEQDWRVDDRRLGAGQPLPGTLSPFELTFIPTD